MLYKDSRNQIMTEKDLNVVERVLDDVDFQIIECIECISNDDGCVLFADLNKALPLPYHKLYYKVKQLARNGDIRICHRGRSIVCRAPVWSCVQI
jgi:uncharacterized membrane protein